MVDLPFILSFLICNVSSVISFPLCRIVLLYRMTGKWGSNMGPVHCKTVSVGLCLKARGRKAFEVCNVGAIHIVLKKGSSSIAPLYSFLNQIKFWPQIILGSCCDASDNQLSWIDKSVLTIWKLEKTLRCLNCNFYMWVWQCLQKSGTWFQYSTSRLRRS